MSEYLHSENFLEMQKKINELREKEENAKLGGGPKRIESQHQKGKLTARERLNLLLDDGSFEELNLLAERGIVSDLLPFKPHPGDGVVTGIGKVNGRRVAVYSQDFTVMGGSLGLVHAMKIAYLQDQALKFGIPIVGINDSGGARIQEGIDSLRGYGDIFFRNTVASGVIPQIAVIAGPCAGGAVYSPAIMDFTVMVEHIAQMFITGPEVIKAVTGEEITKEELGGAEVHSSKSGNCHFACETEEEAFGTVRKLLSFLPSNNSELPPYKEGKYSTKVDPVINSIIPPSPNKPYDVKEIIRLVVDDGDFFEVHANYARSIVVGFARVGGHVVGIIANQPSHLAGCLDIDSSDKAARFVRFCDAFNIPLLTFVDTPGFLPGVNQEYGGIIRHGAKLLYAYSEATVPKITVILRKAYGGAYLAMCSKHLEADFVFAWPSAEIAVMGPEGAVNVIYRKELAASSNPEQLRKEKLEEYKKLFANPYPAARRMYVDRVIAPDETRKVVLESLEISLEKRVRRPRKKHGNIPL